MADSGGVKTAGRAGSATWQLLVIGGELVWGRRRDIRLVLWTACQKGPPATLRRRVRTAQNEISTLTLSAGLSSRSLIASMVWANG